MYRDTLSFLPQPIARSVYGSTSSRSFAQTYGRKRAAAVYDRASDASELESSTRIVIEAQERPVHVSGHANQIKSQKA